MHRSISSMVSNVDDLLRLEPEEVAHVLLMHLRSDEYKDGVGYYNFFNARTDYDRHQPEVDHALKEAWAWLKREGLLVDTAAPGGGFFLLSRRAKRLESGEDFDAYRKASLLPKERLHPLIAGEVYPAFLRGKYDTAIFEAFREVEIAVRSAGKFAQTDYGKNLMRAAFKPAFSKDGKGAMPGPLTDTGLQVAEQEAMANLFDGAIGLYKNPQGHRHVPTQAIDAAEVIILASQLLRIVDRLTPDANKQPTSD